MKGKIFAVCVLLLALAAGASSKDRPKDAKSCLLMVPGAKVSVVNFESGAVIHVTAADPATVAKIQAAADQLGGGKGGHSGCKHCAGGHAAAVSADKASCSHGESCGATKAPVFLCSMGCYSGPRTKDGRCPKCGMDLAEKK